MFYVHTLQIHKNKILNKERLPMSAVTTGLSYALVGAGIGGVIGLLKAAKDKYMPSTTTQTNNPQLLKYTSLVQDSVALDSMLSLQSYSGPIRSEFDTIAKNLDKLIALQIRINQGQVEAVFPYRATTYATTIGSALNACKAKLRNVSTPNWETDEASIRSIADDYVYNISQETSQHTLENRNRQ